MLKKVLIANRGEIAVRVARACQSLGVLSVAVHGLRDAGALHVAVADEAVGLPQPGTSPPYLDPAALVDAALVVGADAVHPGYGFLAESAAFASAVLDAGLVWVGPRPETIAALGDKEQARRIAAEAGLPVVPGWDGPVSSADDVIALGRSAGWPVVVKAVLGGGGRGMRVVTGEVEAEQLVAAARREASKAFGDEALLAERFVDGARHIEVQVMADQHGSVVAVGDRECSVQRRHQKLIEEAPASSVPTGVRAAMADEAVRLLRRVGYVGAGTVEFLVVGDQHFFLEVNTRIQVEHTVTEAVTGLDLVVEQLRVASGEALSFDRTPRPRGHAVEVRVNAEDPFRGFTPASGRLSAFDVPSGAGLRLDSGYRQHDLVPPEFDSLLAKIVVVAPDREQALRRLSRVLTATVISGVPTTLPAAYDVVTHPDFVRGAVTTSWFEEQVEPTLRPDDPRAYRAPGDLVEVAGALIRVVRSPGGGPVRQARRAGAASRAVDRLGTVGSPMTGAVVLLHVQVGQDVEEGDPLVTVEAMKMENVVRAEGAGVVADVAVAVGDGVRPGQPLLTLSPRQDVGEPELSPASR